MYDGEVLDTPIAVLSMCVHVLFETIELYLCMMEKC